MHHHYHPSTPRLSLLLLIGIAFFSLPAYAMQEEGRTPSPPPPSSSSPRSSSFLQHPGELDPVAAPSVEPPLAAPTHRHQKLQAGSNAASPTTPSPSSGVVVISTPSSGTTNIGLVVGVVLLISAVGLGIIVLVILRLSARSDGAAVNSTRGVVPSQSGVLQPANLLVEGEVGEPDKDQERLWASGSFSQSLRPNLWRPVGTPSSSSAPRSLSSTVSSSQGVDESLQMLQQPLAKLGV